MMIMVGGYNPYAYPAQPNIPPYPPTQQPQQQFPQQQQYPQQQFYPPPGGYPPQVKASQESGKIYIL